MNVPPVPLDNNSKILSPTKPMSGKDSGGRKISCLPFSKKDTDPQNDAVTRANDKGTILLGAQID